MNYYKYYFLFLLIFSTSLLHGQVENYDIRYFTTKDGLSSDIVRSVFQDQQGIIWLGTILGLNRFDGHSFKVFNKRKNGLPSNEVNGIWEDSHGKLWLNFHPKNINDNSLLSIFDMETKQAIFLKNIFRPLPSIERISV